jgi:NAD(P)H-dependent flavin oxidoreductase YrpB (nitropropane dioxygenase family)
MAGGLADLRRLTAAFALDSQGVAMGTRFLGSREMHVPGELRQRIVVATSTDSVTAKVMDALLPPFNRPHYAATARILRTRFLEDSHARPDELATRAVKSRR